MPDRHNDVCKGCQAMDISINVSDEEFSGFSLWKTGVQSMQFQDILMKKTEVLKL